MVGGALSGEVEERVGRGVDELEGGDVGGEVTRAEECMFCGRNASLSASSEDMPWAW